MNKSQFDTMSSLIKLPDDDIETLVLQNGIPADEVFAINGIEFRRRIKPWLAESINNPDCVEKLARMQLAERIREVCRDKIVKGVKRGLAKDEIQKQILLAIEELEMPDVIISDKYFAFNFITDEPTPDNLCVIEIEKNTAEWVIEYVQALCFGSYYFDGAILEQLMKATLEKITYGPDDEIEVFCLPDDEL